MDALVPVETGAFERFTLNRHERQDLAHRAVAQTSGLPCPDAVAPIARTADHKRVHLDPIASRLPSNLTAPLGGAVDVGGEVAEAQELVVRVELLREPVERGLPIHRWEAGLAGLLRQRVRTGGPPKRVYRLGRIRGAPRHEQRFHLVCLRIDVDQLVQVAGEPVELRKHPRTAPFLQLRGVGWASPQSTETT